MNETKPSFWSLAWNDPARFFAGFLVASLMPGAFTLFIAIREPNPPSAIIAILILTAFSFLLALLGLILAITPQTRPVMDWVLHRRFFVLACVITLVALFYAEENWRGKRAWDKYKHAQEARGEYLDFAHIAPPPVPDDQNFAMTPLLQPIYDYQTTTNGTVWHDTNALARLYAVNFSSRSGTKLPAPNADNLYRGTSPDLAAWAAYFHGNTNYPQLAQIAAPADEILFALKKFDTELDELAAASARPYSRFAIKYQEEPAWGILLPHLSIMKGLTRVTCLRAAARLEAGQTQAAFDDVKLSLRLGDAIKNEPLVIDHLVRLVMLAFSLEDLRLGLARHAWTDAQLTEMETDLADINLLAELKFVLRGERALGVSDIDWLRRQGFKGSGLPFYYKGDNDESRDSGSGFNVLPASFFYFNMLNLAKAEESLFADFDENTHRVFRDKTVAYDQAMDAVGNGKISHIRPLSLFARMLMPAFRTISLKSAHQQAYADLALVACALERHRLALGSYPDSLDALAPRFVASLPHDIINGEPLHYHRTGEGYTLYSVGWNGTDDGGTIVLTKGSDPSVDPEKGDWVWQMTSK